MNEEKFVKSNSEYLDLAKTVTHSLYDICIADPTKEYNLITTLAGVSIGFYMFLKEISNHTGIDIDELSKECIQWINWTSSKLNKDN